MQDRRAPRSRETNINNRTHFITTATIAPKEQDGCYERIRQGGVAEPTVGSQERLPGAGTVEPAARGAGAGQGGAVGKRGAGGFWEEIKLLAQRSQRLWRQRRSLAQPGLTSSLWFLLVPGSSLSSHTGKSAGLEEIKEKPD